MIALTCILVLVVLAVLVGRASVTGPLDVTERAYLAAAPIPVIIALILPWPISELLQDRESSRAWGLWLNEAGGWLSLVLMVTGGLLLARRSQRERAWDRRLLIGLSVAALPALLIGVVALMYALIG